MGMGLHEIHCGIALGLCEEGIPAKAFPGGIDRAENIVIRRASRNRRGRDEPRGEVFTAFVDGDIFVVGKSDLWIRNMFRLTDPDFFATVREWFETFVDSENPCVLVFDQRDARLRLGDLVETWVSHNSIFHQVEEGK